MCVVNGQYWAMVFSQFSEYIFTRLYCETYLFLCKARCLVAEDIFARISKLDTTRIFIWELIFAPRFPVISLVVPSHIRRLLSLIFIRSQLFQVENWPDSWLPSTGLYYVKIPKQIIMTGTIVNVSFSLPGSSRTKLRVSRITRQRHASWRLCRQYEDTPDGRDTFCFFWRWNSQDRIKQAKRSLVSFRLLQDHFRSWSTRS